jgi:hypothetical protein
MNVYLVVKDDSMINEPTGGMVHPVAVFLTEETAQHWIDSQGITASDTWEENTYNPEYYPFPYSIREMEVEDAD